MTFKQAATRAGPLWCLFFLICLGLGYPTLNRYDPRTRDDTDSNGYAGLVMGNPGDALGQSRFRVLVPYLAKPVYRLTRGRLGTWNPAFFALLVVNAALVATSVCILLSLGGRLLASDAVALLGALLYLVNFAVSNEQLAGMVDSGESLAMLILTWALFRPSWFLLPVIGVLGALAKETFVPLSTIFALTWWLTSRRREGASLARLGWIAALGVAGLGTVVAIQSLGSGRFLSPWEIALSQRSGSALVAGVLHSITERSFWYVFIWLLPLGIWHLGRLPAPWTRASMAAMLSALALGAWNDSGGNVARAMFDAGGPVLSLSAALAVYQIALRHRDSEPASGAELGDHSPP